MTFKSATKTSTTAINIMEKEIKAICVAAALGIAKDISKLMETVQEPAKIGKPKSPYLATVPLNAQVTDLSQKVTRRKVTPDPIRVGEIVVTDRIVFRKELYSMLGVGSECVRLWMKSGKLPPPDLNFSHRTLGWKLSTLHAAGIDLI